jgi:hypothetical protein
MCDATAAKLLLPQLKELCRHGASAPGRGRVSVLLKACMHVLRGLGFWGGGASALLRVGCKVKPFWRALLLKTVAEGRGVSHRGPL